MKVVYLFSLFLISGIFFSQRLDLSWVRSYLLYLTDICLCYIMIEVGVGFDIEKKRWKSYIWDFVVAGLASVVPWILCFIYFLYFSQGSSWQEKLLIGLFTAATSSGILFSMLSASGLSATWLFKKIRVLAIFDDIDTILLLIPLQFLLIGTQYRLLIVVGVTIALVILAWKFLHRLRLPVNRNWFFLYAIGVASMSHGIYHLFGVEMEVLLPAFVLGAILYKPKPKEHREFYSEIIPVPPAEKSYFLFDRTIKLSYMFLVGLILPKIPLGEFHPWFLAVDVAIIMVLMNLGKCIPMFCYRKEASLRERVALGIGMFPRGEVGAGILLLSIESGVKGYIVTVAGFSLALNLLLTGLFISIVLRLERRRLRESDIL